MATSAWPREPHSNPQLPVGRSFKFNAKTPSAAIKTCSMVGSWSLASVWDDRGKLRRSMGCCTQSPVVFINVLTCQCCLAKCPFIWCIPKFWTNPSESQDQTPKTPQPSHAHRPRMSKAPFYRGIPSLLVLFASKAVSVQGWTPSPSVIHQLGAKKVGDSYHF